MTHNMTVPIDNSLWDEMKKHSDVRWSVVMKDAAREKLKALTVLKNLEKKSRLSEADIENFSVMLGKKVSKRR